jgi:FAD/FMN-containing dehydrogenase
MTVEAGLRAADGAGGGGAGGRLFPLSLAAEGSCQIGGNLSTNAGGVQVLRYGNTRELTLGLEVVLPSGEIWDGLRALRKDNTGYDLKHLFIGAEGTLGIITAAVLKLFPLPRATATAWLAIASPALAVRLLADLQARFGALLTACELVSDALSAWSASIFRERRPASRQAPGICLSNSPAGDDDRRYGKRSRLLSCRSPGKRHDQRRGRRAERRAGAASVGLAREYRRSAENRRPEHQARRFGTDFAHSGVRRARRPELRRLFRRSASSLSGTSATAICTTTSRNRQPARTPSFIAAQPAVNRIVYDLVHELGGSISAEHGIGQLKREELLRYKSPVEIEMMRAIKRTLDPQGLMNPGKVL